MFHRVPTHFGDEGVQLVCLALSEGFLCMSVPRQQPLNLALPVPSSNGFKDTGQISMWLNSVEFAGLDQRRNDRPVLCPGIVTCEERALAVQCDVADGKLDGVVVEFDAAIFEEEDQPIPSTWRCISRPPPSAIWPRPGRGFGRAKARKRR